MKTVLLAAGSENSLLRAVEVLRRGGLVAFPTDTVYGLGALAYDADAVLRIFEAKRRPREKAIPILLSAADDLDRVAVNIDGRARRLAERFWPGPLTLIVPKHEAVPEAVAASTVGVRVPDHPVARALLAMAGPLAVSSANLSGRFGPVAAPEVMKQLDGRIDLILDGGMTPGGVASTVVDCTVEELTLVRPGPLALQELLSALE